MKDTYEAIKKNPLFAGISGGDFSRLLICLSAKTNFYKKGAVIFLSGEAVSSIGIIVSGAAVIISEDIDGHSALISELKAPEIFGEVFAYADIEHSPVTVEAAEDTEVLFVSHKKIASPCVCACDLHSRLIENMLKLMAGKCLALNRKIVILSKRTIRERLLTYFDLERGSDTKISVPFNREELARYLCVDRSALSGELSKMKADGLIDFEKNNFLLKKK